MTIRRLCKFVGIYSASLRQVSPHRILLLLYCRSSQGLTYANGTLWESNGLYGHSTVRILDPDTANVIKSVDMPATLFGEGMAYAHGKLYQITWKSQQGFVYNATTLDVIEQFEFHTTRGEGWGITWDPCQKEFIVTDGSEFLHFWDKDTLAQSRKIPVRRRNGDPIRGLNEIEWYRGKVLANVWYQDVLLVIDPATGIIEKEYGTQQNHPISLSVSMQHHVEISHCSSFYRHRFQCSLPKTRA